MNPYNIETTEDENIHLQDNPYDTPQRSTLSTDETINNSPILPSPPPSYQSVFTPAHIPQPRNPLIAASIPRDGFYGTKSSRERHRAFANRMKALKRYTPFENKNNEQIREQTEQELPGGQLTTQTPPPRTRNGWWCMKRCFCIDVIFSSIIIICLIILGVAYFIRRGRGESI